VRENFFFGGGASSSSMTPAALAVTVVAALMLLVLSRKHAPAPILIVAFLIPFGQQILVGGAHFFAIRIVVIIGLCRLVFVKLSSSKPLFPGGLCGIDRAFCLLLVVGGTAFLIRQGATAAIVYQSGLWLDAFGMYFIFRYLLRNAEDIFRLIKIFALVAAVIGACMSYEYLTGVDVFSYLAQHQIVPWIRDGRVRAQGPFGVSITAGIFGATLLPLFFLLWKNGKAKLWACIGLVSATVVAITSMASTPITGYLAGILALCLWPIRKQMRWVCWGILLVVLGLALAMKAPVWFLLARVNIANGNAYDRAILIDATVRHFSDWWLVGTNDNANWGFDSWDACNQFVAEGLSGGLAALVLFVVVLCRCFSEIGRCRKTVKSYRDQWLFWALGAALFSHLIVFLGCDYFDQTRSLWTIFLAMVSTATLSVRSIAKENYELIDHEMFGNRLEAGCLTTVLDPNPLVEPSSAQVVNRNRL
jgi:hypothetical protein